MGQARKKYTQQYRDEAVELVISSGRPMAEIARDLGINEGTLGSWATRAKESGKVTEKPFAAHERARLRELEEENRQLKMERDFLKKLRGGLRRRTSKVRLHPGHGEGERAQATQRKIPGLFHVRDARGIAGRVLRVEESAAVSAGERRCDADRTHHCDP
jgi:transposase